MYTYRSQHVGLQRDQLADNTKAGLRPEGAPHSLGCATEQHIPCAESDSDAKRHGLTMRVRFIFSLLFIFASLDTTYFSPPAGRRHTTDQPDPSRSISLLDIHKGKWRPAQPVVSKRWVMILRGMLAVRNIR